MRRVVELLENELQLGEGGRFAVINNAPTIEEWVGRHCTLKCFCQTETLKRSRATEVTNGPHVLHRFGPLVLLSFVPHLVSRRILRVEKCSVVEHFIEGLNPEGAFRVWVSMVVDGFLRKTHILMQLIRVQNGKVDENVFMTLKETALGLEVRNVFAGSLRETVSCDSSDGVPEVVVGITINGTVVTHVRTKNSTVRTIPFLGTVLRKTDLVVDPKL
jgi:hypothetical protein